MELPFKVDNSKSLHGIRCLISTRDIKKGEIIEECPCIPIKKEEVPNIVSTVLDNYHFLWRDGAVALALGYGMLYNHSFEPNVTFSSNYKNRTILFEANRDIREGEELFINYNQGVDEPLDDSYTHFDLEIQ